jgi:predicted aspartyl protease
MFDPRRRITTAPTHCKASLSADFVIHQAWVSRIHSNIRFAPEAKLEGIIAASLKSNLQTARLISWERFDYNGRMYNKMDSKQPCAETAHQCIRQVAMPYIQLLCCALLLTFLGSTNCLAANPAAAATEYQQGVQLYNLKQYRRANDLFRKSIDDGNTFASPWLYEANCFYAVGERIEAIKRYRFILDIYEGSPEAKVATQYLHQIDPNNKCMEKFGATSAAATAPGTGTSTATSTAGAETSTTATTATTTAVSSSRTGSVAANQTVAGRSSKGRSEISGTSSKHAAVSQQTMSKADREEMNSLPDTASFYFTKEPNGHMLVNLMVNGHPVQAWFDTGADAFFYKDQLLADGVDCNRAAPCGYTHGWAGKAVEVYSMPAEVKLGTLTRKINITMEASNTGLGKNLIGQSMINGYQYEIDDKGGRVDLKKTIANTEQKIDAMYDVPCTITNSRDIIKVEINGRTVEAFIDTGSAFTIIAPQVAETLGIEGTGSQRMTGVGGELTVKVGTARIRLGPIYKEFTVRIGGSGGTCIGQDFMEGWRFKIDREHQLLRFFH